MGGAENDALCGQLVAELAEPWTRRAARRKLVELRAVEPLLSCLASSNESVVRAAIVSLAELKAGQAVEPMIELLQQGKLTLDVCTALTSITGQHLGADAGRWRQWLGKPAAKPTTAADAAIDVAECIRQAGEVLGVIPTGADKLYWFQLSLPGGRRQKVAVYLGREDDRGDELVMVYSECGPANAKYYEAVLRKNLTIPAGAFAIRDVDGQPQFVMVDTVVASQLSPGMLARTVEHIASRADSVEKSLAHEDKR